MVYHLDANHKEIVEAFQKLGCVVVDNAKVKRDEPDQLDIWVGVRRDYADFLGSVWIWVEIKTESGTIRQGQQRTIAACEAAELPVEVVRNIADVERVWRKYQEWKG